MSGADLVEELAQTSYWLPIIVVTGFADSPLAGRVRRAGVRAVLKKPFNDQLLLGHIRQALSQA
ncbi:MAG: response regulator [Gammaproteobacteria bacterium]